MTIMHVKKINISRLRISSKITKKPFAIKQYELKNVNALFIKSLSRAQACVVGDLLQLAYKHKIRSDFELFSNTASFFIQARTAAFKKTGSMYTYQHWITAKTHQNLNDNVISTLACFKTRHFACATIPEAALLGTDNTAVLLSAAECLYYSIRYVPGRKARSAISNLKTTFQAIALNSTIVSNGKITLNLKCCMAYFYYCAKNTSKHIFEQSESALYRNTFFSSLYNKYANYVASLTIAKVNFFFSYNSSLSSSIADAKVNRDDAVAMCTEAPDFEFGDRNTYLSYFGAGACQESLDPALRIRFKPGYLPFFRQIRNNFLEVRNLKETRQYKLTKYLTFYKRNTMSSILKSYTFTLKTALVFLKFAADYFLAETMITSCSVFVNGFPCFAVGFTLQENDVIALAVNYYTYAEQLNVLLACSSEVLLLHRTISKFDELYYEECKSTDIEPQEYIEGVYAKIRLHRLERVYSLMRDIPSYFEVDFFTLSAIVIYCPRSISEFDSIFVKLSGFSFLKMLNWKYLC